MNNYSITLEKKKLLSLQRSMLGKTWERIGHLEQNALKDNSNSFAISWSFLQPPIQKLKVKQFYSGTITVSWGLDNRCLWRKPTILRHRIACSFCRCKNGISWFVWWRNSDLKSNTSILTLNLQLPVASSSQSKRYHLSKDSYKALFQSYSSDHRAFVFLRNHLEESQMWGIDWLFVFLGGGGGFLHHSVHTPIGKNLKLDAYSSDVIMDFLKLVQHTWYVLMFSLLKTVRSRSISENLKFY